MATNGKQTTTKTAAGEYPPPNPPEGMVLKRIERQRIEVPVQGIAPLILHRWSEKAREMMFQTERVLKKNRPPRDPQGDFNDARYKMPPPETRDGVPAIQFKAAIVGSARHFNQVTMTALKQQIFVIGQGTEQLIPIDGVPELREDFVRVGQGTADLRWRPQYYPWSCVITVEFLPSVITPLSVLTLVDAAGIGGIGEWRPSAPHSLSGSFGTFRVADGAEAMLTSVDR